jgi:hypothetical protein
VLSRTIYTLWLQGLEQSPDLVRLCCRRWGDLNPGYVIRVLDDADVRQILAGADIPLDCIPPQALSDIVRARFLSLEGGVWVDATLFPTISLDSWLPGCLTGSGFFAFANPRPDRALASWFLAASGHHILMDKWWLQVVRYWSKPRTLMVYNGNPVPPDPEWEVAPDGGARESRYPYFWFHYLFGYLLKTDPECAYLWSLCRKVSASAPHQLQALLASQAAPSPDTLRQVARAAPVQKLNWRQPYPLDLLERL